MKDNTCNYSDEWQPYIGDYYKFEYDLRLKDGTIVENCYPNAGKFNSISDEHNQVQFDEDDVSEIRFSERPRFGLNEFVSERPQYEWLNEMEERKIEREKAKALSLDMCHLFDPYVNFAPAFIPRIKAQRGKLVRVRDSKTDPKIQRNKPCPCGSGKKYKRCCIVR